ncbi:hypothetical protein EG834_15395, partial [bacterium]|nr:hypothetical protein [bacterium]
MVCVSNDGRICCDHEGCPQPENYCRIQDSGKRKAAEPGRSMKANISGTFKFFEFDIFKDLDVAVRFYTRQGGVSPSPWASLNQGGTVGDTHSNVIENRKRIFHDVARPVESIFDVWQVHGTNVICTTEPRELDGEHQKADGIFTDRKE